MRKSQLFTKNADGTRANFYPIIDASDVLPAQSTETNKKYLMSNGTTAEWSYIIGTDIRFMSSTVTEALITGGSVSFELGSSQIILVFIDGVLAKEGESYTLDKTDATNIKVTIDTSTNVVVGSEIVVYDFVGIIAGSGSGSSGGTMTIDSAMSATSTNPVQNAVITAKIAEVESKVNIPIDSALSATSTNPVQNSVIYEKITDLQAQITGLSDAISALTTQYKGS